MEVLPMGFPHAPYIAHVGHEHLLNQEGGLDGNHWVREWRPNGSMPKGCEEPGKEAKGRRWQHFSYIGDTFVQVIRTMENKIFSQPTHPKHSWYHS